MSGFKDHFSTHAGDYAKARPGYPAALFSWLADIAPARECAWDCATGNGQAAVALADHFTRVIATDASETQIQHASPHPKVDYRIATAEQSGIASASCDLVTVAQAYHWFAQDVFLAEVRRILKPGGVLAVWGYGLTRVSPEIDRVVDMFANRIVGPYWPPERIHIDNEYADLPFIENMIDAPAFAMSLQWQREQFLAYLETWSSVQRYCNEKHHSPMNWVRDELDVYWPAGQVLEVSWPIFFKAGRI